MTPLAAAILKVLMGMAPASSDLESPTAREWRMSTIAISVDVGSDGDVRRAAASLAVLKNETHASELVHRGWCFLTQWTCDHGKAYTLWQMHANRRFTRARLLKATGTGLSATTMAAIEADRRLRAAKRICAKRGDRELSAMFALYASGHRCDLAMSKRVKSYWRILGKLGGAL